MPVTPDKRKAPITQGVAHSRLMNIDLTYAREEKG